MNKFFSILWDDTSQSAQGSIVVLELSPPSNTDSQCYLADHWIHPEALCQLFQFGKKKIAKESNKQDVKIKNEIQI